jgi:plastocyanin
MPDKPAVRTLAAVFGILLLAGTPAAAATGAVEMKDDFFTAGTVSVAPGTTVTWTNAGKNSHNVFAEDGSFQSKNLSPGDTFSVAFSKQGRFAYYCSLHGDRGGKGMAGVILVGETAAETSTTSATRTYPAYPPTRPGGGHTLRVPAGYPSIQAAVDAAKPGDMVLVAAGVYHEAVKVTTPHMTIRGEDRNQVVLDGKLDPHFQNGVAVFGADGVAVENMTARNFQLNGFYWRSVWGYRGSYLTAYNDGDYGIYAFDSGVGMFDHSLASGHPDSGFYIGQCNPCNALITDVVSENNAIGYSGTNGSGNLVIRDSEWRNNKGGIVPNTLDSEALPPQHSVTIVNNHVYSNHNRTAPAKPDTYASFGYGIVLAGGNDNEVAFNTVEDHPYVGIAAAPNLDKSFWIGHGNRVHDNRVSGSGVADLALIAPAGGANCFASNHFKTSLPPAIELLDGCGSPLGAVNRGDVGLLLNGLGFFARSQGDYEHGDWRNQPAPGPGPSMPDVSAPPSPAGPPGPIDGAAAAAAGISAAGPAAPPGDSPVLRNLLYAGYGYGLPVLFLLAVLGSLLGVRLLAGRRFLIGLPVLFVAGGLAILGLGYLN